MHTYHIDGMTIIRTDKHGEEHDLNAEGAPCLSRANLVDFVLTLFEERAYGKDVRDGLIVDVFEVERTEAGGDPA